MDNASENNVSQKGLTIADILKIISALAVIIPLFLGYFEYQRSVQQDIDNNFRNFVEKLSSEKKETRLAGATNLGTFISEAGGYYEEAIDILINEVAIERDINVLNAIRGSLVKVKNEDYKKVIQKLLDVERNSFIYEHPLRKLNLQKELNELEMQKRLVSNFIASFLNLTRNNPIEGLNFYQNSLNELVLTDLNLIKSNIEKSALSLSIIDNTDFSNSKILNTVFTYSELTNCNFNNCEINSSLFNDISSLKESQFKGSTFKEVFFAGSDLSGIDFTEVKGLKPIYFFEAININKAKFDSEFSIELESLRDIQLREYIDYINNSTLTTQRIDELYGTLKELYPSLTNEYTY